MLVGGLWHGAAWKFIIWGGMHGVGLIVHKALRPWLVKIPDTWPVKAASWTLTMAYVSFLFIFFRAASFEDAWLIIRNIFGNFDIAYLAPFVRVRYVWLIFVAYDHRRPLAPDTLDQRRRRAGFVRASLRR